VHHVRHFVVSGIVVWRGISGLRCRCYLFVAGEVWVQPDQRVMVAEEGEGLLAGRGGWEECAVMEMSGATKN